MRASSSLAGAPSAGVGAAAPPKEPAAARRRGRGGSSEARAWRGCSKSGGCSCGSCCPAGVVVGAAPKAAPAGVALARRRLAPAGVAAAPNENVGALPVAGGAPNAGVGSGAAPNAGAAGVAAAPKLKPGCAGFAAAPNEKAIALRTTERAVLPRYLQARRLRLRHPREFCARGRFLVSYRPLARADFGNMMSQLIS